MFDSKLSPDRDRISKIEKQLENRNDHDQRLNDQMIAKEVEDFRTAKEGSEFKYPHFDRLRPQMGRIANSYPDAGLAELYDMAVKLDPDLSNLVDNGKREADERKRIADVKKSQKAGNIISGTSVKGSGNKTFEEQMEEDSAALGIHWDEP